MSASPPELPAPTDGAAIDAYVAELARRLRVGSGDAAGQDLLDEAADHLHSHAEDLVSKGVPADAATAAALADFGSPDDIVPRLRAELLRPHLRRLSAVLLMLGLLLGVGWTVLFELSPPVPWTPAERPPLSLAFDEGRNCSPRRRCCWPRSHSRSWFCPGGSRCWPAGGPRASTGRPVPPRPA